MKRCYKCEKTKPKAEFHKNKSKKNGLQRECKACVKQYKQENFEKTAEYDKQYKKQYRQENAKEIAEYNKQYERERKKSDPLFKFAGNVRALILGSFKRGKIKGFKKQRKTEALLGCTIEQLKEHLAKQFLPGMSLDNHGEWHIDHIIPLASASTQQDIERLCHYTNLQPLWAADNIRKGKKYA